MPFSGDKVIIGEIELVDKDDCLCTMKFVAEGKDGEAGIFKMKHGSEPLDFEAGYTSIWTDEAGVTHIQDANGVSKIIELVEDEQ